MTNGIRGIHLGQVTDVNIDEYKARVVFPNLAHAAGIMVSLGGARQHPVAGDYQLPEPGDWGIIAFWTDDARSGVWITSVSDRYRHIIPTELFTEDPLARLRHTPGDHYTIEHGEGSLESVWPDGSMLRITTSKDGDPGNPAGSIERTERYRTLSPALGEPAERLPLAPNPNRGPVDVVFEHSSGATVRITADGSMRIATPKGHAFTLHDATEKARDPDEPQTVTSTPEEDANRVASEVVLESEMGHRLTFHDDPILNLTRYVRLEDPTGLTVELHDDPGPGVDRRLELRHPAGHKVTLMQDPKALVDVRVTVETGGGHKFEMRDMVPGDQYARLKTNAGHQIELRDTPAADMYVKATTLAGHVLELRDTPTAKVTVSTVGGRSIVMDDDGATTTVTDPAVVIVDAPIVHLAGDAGAAVARVGDAVSVSGTDSRGDTFTAGGTITGGSAKVNAE
jgi:hypothetical protein